MWNATRRMAEGIAAGIKSVDKDVAVNYIMQPIQIRMM